MRAEMRTFGGSAPRRQSAIHCHHVALRAARVLGCFILAMDAIKRCDRRLRRAVLTRHARSHRARRVPLRSVHSVSLRAWLAASVVCYPSLVGASSA
jgi:hypothetical protein